MFPNVGVRSVAGSWVWSIICMILQNAIPFCPVYFCRHSCHMSFQSQPGHLILIIIIACHLLLVTLKPNHIFHLLPNMTPQIHLENPDAPQTFYTWRNLGDVEVIFQITAIYWFHIQIHSLFRLPLNFNHFLPQNKMPFFSVLRF